MAKRFFGRKIEVEDAGKKAAAASQPGEESETSQPAEAAADEAEKDQAEAEGDTIELDVVDETEDTPAEANPATPEPDGSSREQRNSQETENLIEALKAQADESRDKYLRAVAELDNVQKRHVKERSELQRYAGQQLAADLVEIVDDLDRAAAQDPGVNALEILKGIQLIRDRFVAVLERHSVKGAEALGIVFDPKVHEALASVPTADYDEGTVIEQFRKAYFFKDKLLRPAQVVVAIAPKEQNAAGAEEAAEASEGEEEQA